MKKKNIERIAAERLSKIESLEAMLGRRREEIMRLKGEMQGKNEIIGMLEAIIFQLTEEKGCVEISREKLSEGIRERFSLEVSEDKFVLRAEKKMEISQIGN